MAYEVQNMGSIVGLQSNLAPEPVGFYPQRTTDLKQNHAVIFPGMPMEPQLSNVKIKRPDGTWADTVQVWGVKVRLPDGTWQTFL